MAAYKAVSLVVLVCALFASEVLSDPRPFSNSRPGGHKASYKPPGGRPDAPFDYSFFEGLFVCKVGNTPGAVLTIPGQKICDGFVDCADGSDESGCTICAPDRMECNTGGKCAMPCDGKKECDGEEDEKGCDDDKDACDCGPGKGACADGTCVSASVRCNGINDCPGSNEDELGCPASCDCAAGTYRCMGGECIPINKFCNQVEDCPYGDDEHHCPASCACGPGEYKCFGGDCISGSKICEEAPPGPQDCVLGEDEAADLCGL